MYFYMLIPKTLITIEKMSKNVLKPQKPRNSLNLGPGIAAQLWACKDRTPHLEGQHPSPQIAAPLTSKGSSSPLLPGEGCCPPPSFQVRGATLTLLRGEVCFPPPSFEVRGAALWGEGCCPSRLTVELLFKAPHLRILEVFYGFGTFLDIFLIFY